MAATSIDDVDLYTLVKILRYIPPYQRNELRIVSVDFLTAVRESFRVLSFQFDNFSRSLSWLKQKLHHSLTSNELKSAKFVGFVDDMFASIILIDNSLYIYSPLFKKARFLCKLETKQKIRFAVGVTETSLNIIWILVVLKKFSIFDTIFINTETGRKFFHQCDFQKTDSTIVRAPNFAHLSPIFIERFMSTCIFPVNLPAGRNQIHSWFRRTELPHREDAHLWSKTIAQGFTGWSMMTKSSVRVFVRRYLFELNLDWPNHGTTSIHVRQIHVVSIQDTTIFNNALLLIRFYHLTKKRFYTLLVRPIPKLSFIYAIVKDYVFVDEQQNILFCAKSMQPVDNVHFLKNVNLDFIQFFENF